MDFSFRSLYYSLFSLQFPHTFWCCLRCARNANGHCYGHASIISSFDNRVCSNEYGAVQQFPPLALHAPLPVVSTVFHITRKEILQHLLLITWQHKYKWYAKKSHQKDLKKMTTTHILFLSCHWTYFPSSVVMCFAASKYTCPFWWPTTIGLL